MRYIDLRKIKSDSYYNAVIELGCGPNFVRNRRELFELMMQNQGKEFWFRFWLSFCFHPDIKEVDEFTQDLPIETTSLCQLIHNRFVQASTDAAISYCWNVIFENPTPVGVTEVMLSEGQFLDESYQYVIINFACALALIFFKWLRAKDAGTANPDYWTIPREYLAPDFLPGELEKFMIKRWGTKLVQLLDVKRTQVPWIRQHPVTQRTLVPYQLSDEKLMNSNLDCLQTKAIAKKLKIWDHKAKTIRSVISDVDEVFFGLRKRNTNNAQTSEKYARKAFSQNETDNLEERSKNKINQHQKTKSTLCTKNKTNATNSKKIDQHGRRRKMQQITNKCRSSSKQLPADAMTNTDVSYCANSLRKSPFNSYGALSNLTKNTSPTSTKSSQQSDHHFRVRKLNRRPSFDYFFEKIVNEKQPSKPINSSESNLDDQHKIPVRKPTATRIPKFFHLCSTNSDAPRVNKPPDYDRKSIRTTISMPASKFIATTRPTAKSTVGPNANACTGRDDIVDICTSTENKVGNIVNPCFQQREVRTFDSHCTCTRSSLSVAISNECNSHRNFPGSGNKPETASYRPNNFINSIRMRSIKQKTAIARYEGQNIGKLPSTNDLKQSEKSMDNSSDITSTSGSVQSNSRICRWNEKVRDKATATTTTNTTDEEINNKSDNTETSKCDKLANTVKRRSKPVQFCYSKPLAAKNGKFGSSKNPKSVEKLKPCIVTCKVANYKRRIATSEKYCAPVMKAKSTNAAMTDSISKQGSDIELFRSALHKFNNRGGQFDDSTTTENVNVPKRATKIRIDVIPSQMRGVENKRYISDCKNQTKRQQVQPDRGPEVAESSNMYPYFSTPSIDICVRNSPRGRPVVTERLAVGKNDKLDRPRCVNIHFKPELSGRRMSSNLPVPQLQCSCCNNTRSKLRKCQKCLDDNWQNPRYYCGIVCQTKHWFQAHEREHRLCSNL